MIQALRHLRVLALGMLLASGGAHAASTNTLQIIADTTAALPACLRWRIDGVCFWLRCSLFSGCSVRVSPRIRNYVPEVVVTVRNNLTVHPWVEASPLLATSSGVLTALLGGPAGSGGYIGPTGRDTRRYQVYREADALGHPLGATGFLGALSFLAGVVCPPRTWPMFPYFNSSLDALAWRAILPTELFYPATWIPGMREIGSWPINTWGTVHPRTGRTTQTNEPKASAVLAQRVGDIITRTGQPHVYVPITASRSGAGFRWDNPPPLRENDAGTGMWQMLEPRTDTSCYVFGENDSLSLVGWADGTLGSLGDGRRDPGGDYVYNLWRPYRCCRRRGWFIGSVP